MRNEVPALNANGYVDKDGKNHELSENNEYAKRVKILKLIILQ